MQNNFGSQVCVRRTHSPVAPCPAGGSRRSGWREDAARQQQRERCVVNTIVESTVPRVFSMIIMWHDLCRGMRHAHLHCWRMPRLPRSGQSPGASVRLISSSWPIPRGLWPAAHAGQAISLWRTPSMLMEARRGTLQVACNEQLRIVSIARTPMCIEQRWLANDIINT